MLDVWNKAVLYHFLHALALVFRAARRRESGRVFLDCRWHFLLQWKFYTLALTNVRWCRRHHAVGGLAFSAAGPGSSFHHADSSRVEVQVAREIEFTRIRKITHWAVVPAGWRGPSRSPR
jgi:hypothetical protein